MTCRHALPQVTGDCTRSAVAPALASCCALRCVAFPCSASRSSRRPQQLCYTLYTLLLLHSSRSLLALCCLHEPAAHRSLAPRTSSAREPHP